MNGKISARGKSQWCRISAMVGKFAAGAVAAASVSACVTGDAEPDASGSEPTHYILKIGERVPAPSPLPQQTKILVEWHFKNGATRRLEGFRGWNLNHDERFEMVDVLAEDGTVLAQVFDFDSDGRIDEIKEK